MRSEKTVYIVQGNTGEYSDHCEWIVCVCETEKESIDLASELNTLARIATEKLPGDNGFYNYKWRETYAGKDLILKDPGAMVDYTGLDYTVIPITLRQASAAQHRDLIAMAVKVMEDAQLFYEIETTGAYDTRVDDCIVALKQALSEMEE